MRLQRSVGNEFQGNLCEEMGRYLELERRPTDKRGGRDLRIVSRGAPAFERVQLYEPAASGRGWRGGVEGGARRKVCCRRIYDLPLGTRQ